MGNYGNLILEAEQGLRNREKQKIQETLHYQKHGLSCILPMDKKADIPRDCAEI